MDLDDAPGSRWLPDRPSGVGAIVLAGSSGRVDAARAALLAEHGAVAESFSWFGGPGQQDGPWEVPLELFLARTSALAAECDRVVLVGTSFGAEAALLTGALSDDVDAVVAFAPSDVVWAGVRSDGTMTSHWSLGGEPLPYVPFDEDWRPGEGEPGEGEPAYVGLYEASRRRSAERLTAAAIPVERIGRLVLVAGGDDQVWPSLAMAESVVTRRAASRLDTVLVTHPEAGHRTLLPGEPVAAAGMRMRRGGTEEADRRLGAAAWPHVEGLLRPQPK